MGKNHSKPPDPDERPIARDPEVRRLLRRATHGLGKAILKAMDEAPRPVSEQESFVASFNLHFWARWLADSEIALGDSE